MKNNTEQNGSDEKYSQAGIIVKIHTNHDGVRETLQSRWGSSRLAHYGDLRSSEWSKSQKLQRPPFE